MKPPSKTEAARVRPAASVKRQSKSFHRTVRPTLPQRGRTLLKSTIVAIGVRGWIGPARALRLIARFRLTKA